MERDSTPKGEGLVTKFSCTCFCCQTMREEYMRIAHDQVCQMISFCDKRLEKVLEENKKLRDDLFIANQEVQFLKELKDWRNFLNLNQTQPQ